MDNSNNNEPIKIRVGKSYKLFFYLFKNSQAINLSEEKEYIKVYASNQFDRTFEPVTFSEENGAIKVNILDDENKYIFNTIGAYSFQIRYNKENERFIIDKKNVLILVDNSEEETDNNNSEFTNENETIELFIRTQEKGIKGEQGERGEQGIQGERGQDGYDGLSALELYNNENNTDYNRITDLFNKLIPKKEEGENINEFAKILFSSWGNPHSKWMQRREAKSLSLFADNEDVFKEILIKHYREVDPQVNDRLDSIGTNMIRDSIFKIKDNEVYFYPHNDFDYMIKGCNIFYEFSLGGNVDKTYTMKACNIVNNKFFIFICERVTRKVAVFEVEFSDTITNLNTLNSYVELKSKQYDFTNKNVDDFNSYLSSNSNNTYLKRTIKEWTGQEVEGFRPYFYKYLKIDSVENKTFDEVNRRLFNNLVKGWD